MHKYDLLVLILTERCNAHCNFCRYWKYGKNEFSYENVKNALDQLKSIAKGISITGGEALLNKELCLKTIATAKEMGFEHIMLSSNAIKLDEEVIKQLDAAGITDLYISLDGLGSNVYIRGAPEYKSVLKILYAIARMRSNGSIKFSVHINSIITSKNITEINKLINIVKLLGVDTFNVQPLFVHENMGMIKSIDIKPIKDSLWLKEEQKSELLELISNLKYWKKHCENFIGTTGEGLGLLYEYYYGQLKNKYQCRIYESTLFLYPDGNVRFCPIGNSIYNIFSKDRSNYTGKVIETEIKRIDNCNICLLNCAKRVI